MVAEAFVSYGHIFPFYFNVFIKDIYVLNLPSSGVYNTHLFYPLIGFWRWFCILCIQISPVTFISQKSLMLGILNGERILLNFDAQFNFWNIWFIICNVLFNVFCTVFFIFFILFLIKWKYYSKLIDFYLTVNICGHIMWWVYLWHCCHQPSVTQWFPCNNFNSSWPIVFKIYYFFHFADFSLTNWANTREFNLTSLKDLYIHKFYDDADIGWYLQFPSCDRNDSTFGPSVNGWNNCKL